MKTIVLKGGLGNQLFQFARAYETSDEVILIDWCIARPQIEENQRPAISFFALPSNFRFREKRSLLTRLFRPTVFARKIVSDVFEGKKSLASLSVVSKLRMLTYFQHFSTLQKKIRDEIGIGYFQEEPTLDKEKKATLFDLSLCIESKELEKYKGFAAENAPIIVHMRIGDYELNPGFGVLSEKYFEEAINKLSSMVPNFTSIPIWLFSDSPEKAISRFPKMYSQQLYVIPNSIETSAELLEVMRLGKYFVVSNSSLSWWAAYLSRVPGKIVLAPDPWFKGFSYSNKLIPDEWIKIEGAH